MTGACADCGEMLSGPFRDTPDDEPYWLCTADCEEDA